MIAAGLARSGSDAESAIRALRPSPSQADGLLSRVAAGRAERGDRHALALAEAVGDAQRRAEALTELAQVWLDQARPDLADPALLLALAAAKQVNSSRTQAHLLTRMAVQRARSGDLPAGRALLEQGRQLVAGSPSPSDAIGEITRADLTFAEVELCLISGNMEEARRISIEGDVAIELISADIVAKRQWNELTQWIGSMQRADQRVRAWVGAAIAM